LSIFFVLTRIVIAQDSRVDEIIITAIDTSEFPEITVYARVLNADGQFVPDLGQPAFQVAENESPKAIVRGPVPDNSPIWVQMVIDSGLRMGQSDNWEQTRESILQFVSSHKLEDDRIAVSILEDSGLAQYLDFTKNAADVEPFVKDYRPPCNSNDCITDPISELGDMLDNWDEREDADNLPKFMVLFTGQFEKYDPEEASLIAAEAKRLGIPIYAVLVASDTTGRVADLAVASGGLALEYTDADSMDDFFTAILEIHRPVYEIAYRSTFEETDPRVVQLTAVNDGVAGTGEYSIAGFKFESPRVTIESPEETDVVTPDSAQEVIAGVVFTDNFPRELERASLELRVNDQLLGEPIEITDIPDHSSITFEPPWQLLANLPAEADEVELKVVVWDESLLPPGQDTTTISFLVPTQEAPTGVGEPEMDDGTAVSPADNNNEATVPTGAGSSSTIFLAISVMVLAVAMIAMVLTRDRGPVKAMRQTINNQIDRLTKRIERQAAPRAYLTVIEGDVNVGKRLEIYGTTTIGRSKQDAELLFQQHDDTSPISRRHCTVIDEEDHFMIRDEDSANGTFLNGVRLDSMVPRELQDGDEIELARVERGGVKLQFEGGTLSYGGYGRDPYTADTFDSGRSTRVVKRPNQSGGDPF
jgi:pSer/pThr/pTyr-binding forkhead associated (FHA) protein